METLFNWLSGANNKLFAFTDTQLFDITDPEAVTEQTGGNIAITQGRWRGVNMNGQGILVNGTDEPLRLDSGGSWLAHGFSGTGLTPSHLSQVSVFKNRLFFLQKDSSKLWYGELNAITGTLSSIDLGLVNEMGGTALLLAHLPWILASESMICLLYSCHEGTCLSTQEPTLQTQTLGR